MIDGDNTVPPHWANLTVVHMRIPRLPKISNDESRCFFIDARIHTNNIHGRKKKCIKEKKICNTKKKKDIYSEGAREKYMMVGYIFKWEKFVFYFECLFSFFSSLYSNLIKKKEEERKEKKYNFLSLTFLFFSLMHAICHEYISCYM